MRQALRLFNALLFTSMTALHAADEKPVVRHPDYQMVLDGQQLQDVPKTNSKAK
ncbi:MAG: hypothetical protein IPK32_23530 [Verrucomicrobiaceae bacterium]|nr:hypothetical protein [Verrucomicrobiaceae bacterium]